METSSNMEKAAIWRDALLQTLKSVQKLGLYAIIGPVLGASLGMFLFVTVDKDHYLKTIELEEKIIALDEKATVVAQREHAKEIDMLNFQIRQDEKLHSEDKSTISELKDQNKRLAGMLARYAPMNGIPKEILELLLEDKEILAQIRPRLTIAR